MDKNSENTAGVSDSIVYPSVPFSVETFSFFARALRYYQGILESDLNKLLIDPELGKVISEKLETFPMKDKADEASILAERFERIAEENRNSLFYVETPISHGMVRFMKSVCQLYLNHLYSRRDAIAHTEKVSRQAIDLLDTELAKLQEKTEMGIFMNAEPYPLLLEQLSSSVVSSIPPEARVQTPVQERLASTIELLDDQLRQRCSDLFRIFTQETSPDRYDTVVREATTILEDRLRGLTSSSEGKVGLDLVSFALSGPQPRVKLGRSKSEQDAIHALFRGVFGFIRNDYHHRLIANAVKERILQLLGMVDYLLHLLDRSGSSEQS